MSEQRILRAMSRSGRRDVTPRGVLAISRGLSAAIPPENVRTQVSTPEGSQHCHEECITCAKRIYKMLAPLRGAALFSDNHRGYRYAQPPANGSHPYRGPT